MVKSSSSHSHPHPRSSIIEAQDRAKTLELSTHATQRVACNAFFVVLAALLAIGVALSLR